MKNTSMNASPIVNNIKNLDKNKREVWKYILIDPAAAAMQV